VGGAGVCVVPSVPRYVRSFKSIPGSTSLLSAFRVSRADKALAAASAR